MLSKDGCELLCEHRCAFLFGNTAPDVQVVTGQPRVATHFFDLPIRNSTAPPWQKIFSEYASLAIREKLSAIQLAFLSGYLCHLQADWFWIQEIYLPVFGPTCTWRTWQQRLYLHNVLRSYLDRMIINHLGRETDLCLGGVVPDHWLPFVDDQSLMEWRDILFPQLCPGGEVQTVEVFALRQGISTDDYYTLLNSEERMQKEIFVHLSLQKVEQYRQKVLDFSIRFLNNYLTHPVGYGIGLKMLQEAKPE